jgi:uncharacterized protein
VERGDVNLGKWFLPEMPDLNALLRRQVAVTIEGAEQLAAWAGGDPAAAQQLRATERQGDEAKRELLSALRGAFVTELEPEDVFALSRGIDRILKYAADIVKEAEVMGAGPDARIATMAGLLEQALHDIDAAIANLGSDGDAATADADEALASAKRLDDAYYEGMGALLEVESRQDRISRRELYRRCARIGEVVVDVAERIVYAVVKQS